MKIKLIFRTVFSVIFLVCIVFEGFTQITENTADLPYVKSQKEFYEKVIFSVKETNLETYERNEDFEPCPLQEMFEDFLGNKFHSIHCERAGFLECDGPTYLNIYDNGLYINHTGSVEYRCYLNEFKLKFGALKSGTSKEDIIQLYGIPMIRTPELFVYGCELDVDPFSEEEQEVDIADPYSYQTDFFFVFEENRLIGIVYVSDHMCY